MPELFQITDMKTSLDTTKPFTGPWTEVSSGGQLWITRIGKGWDEELGTPDNAPVEDVKLPDDTPQKPMMRVEFFTPCWLA